MGRDKESVNVFKTAFDHISERDIELTEKLLNCGIDIDLIEKAMSNTQKILNNAQIAIRVPDIDTAELIATSRFKSVYELNHSSNSFFKTRGSTEQKILGISNGITPSHTRPIYGYLVDGGSALKSTYLEEGYGVDIYGGIAIVLKDSVKRRASFTGTDSLAHAHNTASILDNSGLGWLIAHTEVPSGTNTRKVEEIKELISKAANSKTVKDLMDVKGSGYLECQIFGQINGNEIQTVVAK